MTLSQEQLKQLSVPERLGRVARQWQSVADRELAPLGLTYPRWSASSWWNRRWRKSKAIGRGVGDRTRIINANVDTARATVTCCTAYVQTMSALNEFI